MHQETKTLYELVNRLLLGSVDASTFEEDFSNIFDLSEISEDENDWDYFQRIRDLLVHYSYSNEDIKSDPSFFFDSKQLRSEIKKLKE